MNQLNWKLHEVLGASYYYTFHNDKFWCIKAEHVTNGIIKDIDFILQVTTSKMQEKTKNKLIEGLSHLFPELTLLQIKKALQYDKNASLQS